MPTPKAGAVLFAKNVSRVAAFYEHLFSLSVKHTAPAKMVLESEAVMLVIHGIPQSIADTIHITDPPERRDNTAIKLFFPVPSLAMARARAPSLGGMVSPVAEEWAAGDFRACDGCDPEGNVVQCRESLS